MNRRGIRESKIGVRIELAINEDLAAVTMAAWSKASSGSEFVENHCAASASVPALSDGPGSGRRAKYANVITLPRGSRPGSLKVANPLQGTSITPVSSFSSLIAH